MPSMSRNSKRKPDEGSASSDKRPAALTLDIRPILQSGGSPCEPIDEAVARLEPGQDLVLLVPFEPVPLYAKLGREGFTHQSECLIDGTWKVAFRRREGQTSRRGTEPVSAGLKPRDLHPMVIDSRGWEPPEPFVKTLEALSSLAPSRRLVLISDRKPVHLFSQLENRGFAYDCTERDDRSFSTEIWRA